MTLRQSASSRASGFILAATLWIVAILALIGVYITGTVSDSRSTAETPRIGW